MNDSKGTPRLWEKGLPLDEAIHRFTVGDDPELDKRLLSFDALGSAAHARMLGHAGLMPVKDAQALVDSLAVIVARAGCGELSISPAQEDCHTAIEMLLTEQLGDAGKRIHLGRSRNDQVILALRLYMRDALLGIAAQAAELAHEFINFARAHADAAMPGYTHLRRAMPSSFGLWAGAFAAGLSEELQALQAVYARLDCCPLGAAAGFGVPLPLDREYVAELLGFSGVQISPADVMNSRGRHELALVNGLASIGLVLEKFLWDVALYCMPEFGFLDLPDAFTTGSSIMPQKRNPDVVELARARCRELRGHALMLQELAGGLPSSYHRDFQLLKKPLFTSLDTAGELLEVLVRLVPGLKVNAERARTACGDELYAAHEATRLAQQGLPFREAYRRVALQLQDGTFKPDRTALKSTHIGGLGNLGLESIADECKHAERWISATRSHIEKCEKDVWHKKVGGA
ncbi:MAG: argininosuccinate lyase [Deltaproteobacteria bacterium 21-66-5]|nr:MAG: argininosuccinate lyase [Deltaproteobacteria bacterium 21-66-5]